MPFLARLLIAAIDIYSLIILARVLLSWFVRDPRDNVAVQYLYQVTEPVLAPFRKIIPPIGGIDFSPILVFIALRVLQRLIVRILM